MAGRSAGARPASGPSPAPPPAGWPLIPDEPHRDQPLVHHIRPHLPPRALHPLLHLVRERIDQPLPPPRARHRQAPIPQPHQAAHRLRITPHQPNGRVRTPGQVIRLKNLHDFPVILLHGPPSGLRSNDNPEPTAWGTTHHGPTRRQPRQPPQGDQLSAEREMRCPPTRRMACPLSRSNGACSGSLVTPSVVTRLGW